MRLVAPHQFMHRTLQTTTRTAYLQTCQRSVASLTDRTATISQTTTSNTTTATTATASNSAPMQTRKSLATASASTALPSNTSIPPVTPHIPTQSTPWPISKGLGVQPAVAVDQKGALLKIAYEDKAETSFHAIWLRDHCRCDKCFHTITKQRLLDTSTIPLNTAVKSAKIVDGTSVEITYHGDDHVSRFSLDWLRINSYFPRVIKEADVLKRQLVLWDNSLADNLPTTPYDEVMSGDTGLAKWLRNIDTYGIGFVSGVPVTPEATEELANRICFIRESHYGKFWDFTANNAHGDTAYTSIALPAHTDTTYFTDPIGLQLFHLLEFNGKGGAQLYVDGFNAAAQLKQQNPQAYSTLTRLRIPTHCAGDAQTVIANHPGNPILNLDPVTQELIQVRFNNDDRSALTGLSGPEVLDFYTALREWIKVLKNPKNELWYQLQPGTVVVMDNWRVLHGREAVFGHYAMANLHDKGFD